MIDGVDRGGFNHDDVSWLLACFILFRYLFI